MTTQPSAFSTTDSRSPADGRSPMNPSGLATQTSEHTNLTSELPGLAPQAPTSAKGKKPLVPRTDKPGLITRAPTTDEREADGFITIGIEEYLELKSLAKSKQALEDKMELLSSQMNELYKLINNVFVNNPTALSVPFLAGVPNVAVSGEEGHNQTAGPSKITPSSGKKNTLLKQ